MRGWCRCLQKGDPQIQWALQELRRDLRLRPETHVDIIILTNGEVWQLSEDYHMRMVARGN